MLERGEPAVVPTPEPPSNVPISLSSEINSATRNLHTTLNRLITSRLPLALPPYTTDPSLYATGLVHFAHIFLTFESLWADILRNHSPPPLPSTAIPATTGTPSSPPTSPLLSYLLVNPYDSPSLFTSTLGAPTPPSPELVAFLQTLRPRGLIRSARVKNDLEHLMGLHPTDLEVLLAKYPGDKVAEFCTHIRKAVHEKPWTLLSYAWCFYMAIFSGGRWIRAELLKAGPDFWQMSKEEPTHGSTNFPTRGLSFWHFPGQYDGEDIKAEFKARLAAADMLLTPDERVDIIEEAKTIFQLCETLVEELDNMVGSLGPVKVQQPSAPSKQPLLETKTISNAPAMVLTKSNDPLIGFIRRPEVTGVLVALGCLACVALLRFQ